MKHSQRAKAPTSTAAENLLAYSKVAGFNLQQLSRSLERNDSYLQQFVMRGVPEELDCDDRFTLATILKCSLDDLTNDKSRNRLFRDSAKKLASKPFDLLGQSGYIPILGTKGKNGVIEFGEANTPRVATPTFLLGVAGAYAVTMPDAVMEPAIREGVLVFVNPVREARPGDDVIIRLKDGTAIIRNLVSIKIKHLVLQQYNPKLTEMLDTTEIDAVHLIAASARVIE